MPQTRHQEILSKQNQHNATHPHHNTPQKARIRAAIQTLEETGIWNGAYNKLQVFNKIGVSKARGYIILKERTYTNRTFPCGNEVETRGRPKKISQEKI